MRLNIYFAPLLSLIAGIMILLLPRLLTTL